MRSIQSVEPTTALSWLHRELVAGGIAQIGGIPVRAVSRPRSGRAFVAAAGLDRGGGERMHCSLVSASKPTMMPLPARAVPPSNGLQIQMVWPSPVSFCA
jgi:hypothetical protein